MTTPRKQYQNVSFGELLAFSKQNPNRHRTLESIEVHVAAVDPSLDSFHLPGYTSFNVNPAGIISILSCIADPQYYSLAPANVRMQQLIDYTTKLQQQTEDLKNTSLSRKRKKIHDLIAVSYNGGAFQEKDYLDLYHGLSLMTQQHFILLKEAVQDHIEDHETKCESSHKGEIIFSSDPVTWKRDQAVWVVDYRGRWVAIPSEIHAKPLSTIAADWLCTMEQNGWTIQWPEIDATKVELVERLSQLPTWKETDRKLTKNILSARLGRALSLQVFTKWMTTTSDELK
jgi:hypothetical protein